MPKIRRGRYTAEEQARYGAAYKRLLGLILSAAPDAAEFRRALDAELAGGFLIDCPSDDRWTLLHEASFYIADIHAGLPQVLIVAGADVNAQNCRGDTPLGNACWWYVDCGAPEYLAVIDVLLAAGARLELDESWKNRDWDKPDQQARRGWLEAYIASWAERRAAAGLADTPAFDYAL